MTERGVIRLSQFINHPPAKVWRRSRIRPCTPNGGRRAM